MTRTLGDNEMCTIKVNATEFPARVVFDDSSSLGVLYPGYKMGQPISVDEGKIKAARELPTCAAPIFEKTNPFSENESLLET